MIEEESQDTTITNDDVSVLRVLLHNIKGISATSTTEYVANDDPHDE